MSPSLRHEVLVNLFRTRPGLLTALGILPAAAPGTARIVEPDVGQLAPTEFRADLALVVGEPPVLAVAVEVQLRCDEDKRYTWPLYASALAHRWRCPGAVVVVAPDRPIARWASQPIAFGLGAGAFQPQVVGPDAIPRITEPVRARGEPELAVLSALAHGGAEAGLAVLVALYPALAVLPVETARIYHDLVLTQLPAARRREWEAAMYELAREYPFKSDFALKHFGEGRREEALTIVTRILVRRCGMLGPERQERLAGLDLERLEALIESFIEATADIRSLDDLDAWLDGHS